MNRKTRTVNVIPALALAVLFCLVVACVAPAAETPDDRSNSLEKAVSAMLLNGFSQDVRTALEGISSGSDLIAAKALFHLGCGAILTGKTDDAFRILKEIELLSEKEAAAQPFADILRRYVSSGASGASGTLSLDFKDMTIPDIVRILAAKTNRAVVVDEGIDRKLISLHLPKVSFDEVMSVLSDIGNLKVDKMGEILVVRSRPPALGQESTVENKLSLDVSNVDTRDLLKAVAAKGGFNIVFHKSVRGAMTIRLKDVEPIEAMHLIVKAGDFAIEKDGDTYIVMDAKTADRALGGKMEKAVIPLRFLSPQELLSLMNRERITGAEPTKSNDGISFKGPSEMLERLRKIILEQDLPPKPILINVKVWEFFSPDTVDTGKFGAKTPEEKSKIAKLLAAPRVLTLPGKTATIQIGEKDEENKLKSGVDMYFYPTRLPNGMFQIELGGEIKTMTQKNEKALESSRKIQSVFVMKSGDRYVYEVQGGILPTVLEVEITQKD